MSGIGISCQVLELVFEKWRRAIFEQIEIDQRQVGARRHDPAQLLIRVGVLQPADTLNIEDHLDGA